MVRPGHQVRDLRVVHPDIPVDLRVILEVHSHVPNGTDHQGCITGHRDHQVSLNINICKGRNLVKAHHREDLLQVLWVAREDRRLGTEGRRKDRHRVLPEVRRLTSTRPSSPKDRRTSTPASIHPDRRVLRTGRPMALRTALLTGRPMARLTDSLTVRLMFRLTATGRPLHSHRTAHPGPIIGQRDRHR